LKNKKGLIQEATLAIQINDMQNWLYLEKIELKKAEAEKKSGQKRCEFILWIFLLA
jgi:hypothetical protein